MRITMSWTLLLTCMLQITFHVTTGMGFEIPTHRLISKQSISPGISIVDSLLKVYWLEFENGIDEPLAGGLSARDLVQEGSANEDCCLIRPRHHFHNPRLAWDQAGWRPWPFNIQLSESSIIWGQDQNQIIGGKHSWKDARDSYYQALTATSKSERKSLFAETFRSLGHLIHLVQDSAVPSHTRNDTHISILGIGDPDGFHGWALSQLAQNIIGAPSPPPLNTSLFDQAGPNAFAPVPVARIIDSTDGDIGTLALSPGLNIGIAEYSSANFFSDDTVNSSNFLSPLPSQVEVRAPEPDATGTKLRRYVYFRPGFGEQNYPLALAGALAPYVIDPLATPTDSGLDDKVFQGYGAKLFPRAVGYSAGLIDYFFRGKMITGYHNDFFAPYDQRPTSITLSDVTVSNIAGTEQGGQGTIQLVLYYIDDFTLGETFPPAIMSQPVSINAGPTPQTITFPFGVLPFPTIRDTTGGAVAVSFFSYLVYRGPLGQELDAVIAGGACGNGGRQGEIFFLRQNDPPHDVPWAVDTILLGTLGCGANIP